LALEHKGVCILLLLPVALLDWINWIAGQQLDNVAQTVSHHNSYPITANCRIFLSVHHVSTNEYSNVNCIYGIYLLNIKAITSNVRFGILTSDLVIMKKQDAVINNKFRSEYPVYDLADKLPGSTGKL
jgi:hypothetical protein